MGWKKKIKSKPTALPKPERSEALTLFKHSFRGVVFYIDHYLDYPDRSKQYGYCVFVDPAETTGVNTGPRFSSPGEAERNARRDILMAENYVDQ